MNLDELLDKEENEILEEARHVRADDYERHWVEMSKEEADAYNKEHGTHIHGYWEYPHRVAAGLKFGDKRISHHINKNKHDNRKENVVALTRSEHCKVEPNRKIYGDDEKCKIKGCGNSIYSHYLCYKHYMQKYRKGEFGNYDPKKNKSKKDRKEKSSKKDK